MSGSSNQSTRTSPGSYSTTQRSPSVSSPGASPPQSLASSQAPSTAQNVMSTDVCNPSTSHPSTSLASFHYPFTPISPTTLESVPSTTMRLSDSDRSPQSLGSFGRPAGTCMILMRKLPSNTSRDSLRTMLLFAKNMLDVDFEPVVIPTDPGYLSAVARFGTLAAAEDARAMLDGKPNSSNDANMVVEMYNGPLPPSFALRRSTIDHTATPSLLGPTSPNGPSGRSRFNGTFQSMERLTASNQPGPQINDALPPSSEAGSRIHNIFSPQSPMGNGAHDLPRVSGKSMIDQDLDEDTGELLKDPVGYAENGHSGSISHARRSTNSQFPTGQFGNLSLSTNLSSPPLHNYTPGGSVHVGLPTPAAAYSQQQQQQPPAPQTAPQPQQQAMTNNTNNIGASHGPHSYGNPQPRHSFPAANPNDMNPPCNTLYVGNLPPDASEEELKALFSKQRGYKRLCFRNKSNGPMCFVEFEDVGTAGKSLHELYGFKLSNSAKTGIRLSFSKNPLGVRSGQPGSISTSNNMASQNAVSGGSSLSAIHNHMFSAVNGPPPGLEGPPAYVPQMALRSNGVMHPQGHMHAPVPSNGSFHPNTGLGIRAHSMNPVMSPPPHNGPHNGPHDVPHSGLPNGGGSVGPSGQPYNYYNYMLSR